MQKMQLMSGVLALCVSLLTETIKADTFWYGGLNAEVLDLHIGKQSYYPRQFRISAGRWLARNVGVEAHLAGSIKESSLNGYELTAKAYSGLYLRFQSPQEHGAKAYLLAGFGQLSLDGSVNGSGFPGKEKFSGPVVSLGLMFPFSASSHWNANVAYSHYFLEDELRIDSLSAGIRYEY
jgi:hypothetical protein